MALHLREPEHHKELGGDRDKEKNLLLVHGADVKGYRFGTLGDRMGPPSRAWTLMGFCSS